MIVARIMGAETNDLLAGNEHKDIIIFDLNDEFIDCKEPPEGGWSHDLLEAIEYDEIAPNGWDAYLGVKDNWIGGSEV